MSKPLNKVIISEQIAERFDLTKVKSREIVDYMFDEFTETISAGEKVSIAGFGIFESRHRAERNGFNPSSKENMKIKASTVPAFKPAKALKDEVDK